MTKTSLLFSNGRLRDVLNDKINKIGDAVAGWNEDRLLALPESDVIASLTEQFVVRVPALDHDNITAEPMTEGYTTIRQFGEEVRIKQNVFTISVPFTGDRDLFTLQPDTSNFNPPPALITQTELQLSWAGQGHDAAKVRQSLDLQISDVERWLGWQTAQVNQYDRTMGDRIAQEVSRRKAVILANRDLEATIGFPIRRRSDAATYAVPVTRKKISLSPPAAPPGNTPFRPEPVLADAHYEEAIQVLLSSRNQLERSPSTTAHMGEEAIRDNLLLNLNGQFEGKAAGEVFNGNGKTDILIRVEDRHVFIGECKIWKGPKTITSTLDQLLGYLVWRDTKAALLLFIRSGRPTEIIPKALDKFREHPNFKRELKHSDEFGERYNFVFSAKDDPSREIKLAFLPFALLLPAS